MLLAGRVVEVMSFSLSLAQRTASLYVDISTGTVGVSNLNASNISISGSSVGIGGGGGAGVLANVGWTPTTTPALTVTLPSGGAFTPSYSNAQHRWIGNDLGYTFSVTGTVTAAPTNTAADYKISVPYPVAVAASYPTDTIVGDLWLSVIYGANSNLFKAYARTLSTDANSLVVRAITGSTDESLGTILAGSVITLQGTATFATTSVNQNTGGALASGLQTVWIPSTAVNWAPAPAPTFTLPAGAALTYARSNARYMYVGTDVTYNVDLGGTLTASPTSAASDYTLSLPYPVAIATYTNNTVIGDLWLSVVNGFNSNTFKAYARTLATNANAVTVRLLTGSADESLGVLVAGSTFTLQGTMNYTTTLANSNIGIPTAYIAAEFKQDVYGNVGLNLAAVGSNAPRARFDIIQNSNIPALIVDQYGTGDAFQVKDRGVTQFSVASTGDVYVGEYTEYASYISYASNVLPPSADGKINGVNITALNKRTRTSGASAVDCVRTWTTRASAADNIWMSVCWAAELSLFAAVALTGTGNRVMTSLDGINWTTRTSTADNSWQSICWAGELSLFVAVAYTGTGNRVMTSSNGVNWTTQTAADNDWHSVCWAPELSLFAAVAYSGTGNRVMTSPNGIAWTTRTSAADNGWISICWAPELSLFAAVAEAGGASNRVMTSPDGITWTTRTSSANNNWYSVCWAPELSLFVAVAYSGTGTRVMTSPDGISWTPRTSAANNQWLSVCWAPELSLFAAVAQSGAGNRVMTSPDGITWTTRTSADNSWRLVCWAPELSLFAAVASGGTGNRVMTSAIGMPNSKSVVKALPSQMMVDANGNVGIGTTNPTQKVDVVGNVKIDGSIGCTNGGLMFRNRIINGNMNIDQRNEGVLSAAITVTPVYTLDRWVGYASGGGAIKMQQVNVPSALPGFSKCMNITVSTADTSIAADDLYFVSQRIEGYNVEDMNFGTANASYFTFSYWIRSTLTGTMSVTFANDASTRRLFQTTTISAINTWQYCTHVVLGDTTGTWPKDNTPGLRVFFILAAGTNLHGTANTWGTSLFASASQTNFLSSTANSIHITGVQLEKGTMATPFEFRPFSMELQMCHRYYQRWSFPFLGSGSTAVGLVATKFSTTDAIVANVYLQCTMRDAPGVTATPATARAVLNASAKDGVPITNITCPRVGPITLALTDNTITAGFGWIDNIGRLDAVSEL